MLIVAALALLGASGAQAETYTVDRERTAISYALHLMLAHLRGSFHEYAGTFEYVPGHPERLSAHLVIQAASADQQLPRQIYDLARYPTITFESTHVVTEANARRTKLHGMLSIQDRRHPVVFDMLEQEPRRDAAGRLHPRFLGATRISRKRFGLVGRRALGFTELLVWDAVDISFQVEGDLR